MFTKFMPLILLANHLPWWVLAIVGAAIAFDKIKHLYRRFVYRYTYTVHAFCTDVDRPNNEHRNINYLLSKYDTFIKHKLCKKSLGTDIEILKGKGWFYTKPEIEMNKGDEITVDFVYENQKHSVMISCYAFLRSKKEINAYTIYSTYKESIDAFISYANSLQEERVKKMFESDIIKYMTYDGVKRCFNGTTLNVNKNFNNTFLPETTKQHIINTCDYFVNNREEYARLGRQRKIGYFLHGKPGNGKTSVALAIAHKYRRDIYKLDLSLKRDAFFHQVSEIKEGSVVLIDDADVHKCIRKRDSSAPSSKTPEVPDQLLLSDVLEVMDGYCYLKECIVIVTTNSPDSIDPAFIRPGRLDFTIELSDSNKENIIQIIQYYFPQMDSDCADRLQSIPADLTVSSSQLINNFILANPTNLSKLIDQLIASDAKN